MPIGRLYEVAERQREAILAGERAASSQLVEAFGGMWQRIRREIDDLLEKRAAAEAKGEVIGPEWLWKQNRLDALLSQVERELRIYAEFASPLVTNAQGEAVDMALWHSEELVRAATRQVGIAVNWNNLPLDSLRSLIGFTSNGSPLRRMFDSLGPEISALIRDGLIQGVTLGWNPERIAGQLRAYFARGLTQALTVCRTEVMRAYREGTQASYQENDDILTGWVWNAACTPRTCAMCWAMHGTQHPFTERLDDHPNGRCFPAGTLVSGPTPVAATMRYYVGELVTIRTASGTELSFTPNHPILTRRGWVAGGLLREGDDVVSSTGRQDTASAINEDYQDVPTCIEDIVKAFNVVLGEMPCSAEDFHGDGMGSEVYVVLADSLLWNDGHATLSKPLFEHDFGLRAVRGFGLSSVSALFEFGKRCFATSHRVLSDGNAAVMFVYRSLFGKQLVGRSLVSQRHTGFNQPVANDGARGVEGCRKTVFRFPGFITGSNFLDRQRVPLHGRRAVFGTFDSLAGSRSAEQAPTFEFCNQRSSTEIKHLAGFLGVQASEICFDRVVQVNRRDFAGHVYNLQTKAGWYISNGIITHNCSMLPIVKDIPGMRPQWLPESGEAQFKRLDPATQAGILGPLYELYERGQIGLADVVGRRFDRDWGSMRVVRSKGAITGVG